MPNQFKPKLKTPSPVKKQKKEQSDEDDVLSSPGKRAPAQRWTAGRFNHDSLRGNVWTGLAESTHLFDPNITHTCTEEELQLTRAVHKIALENASAIRDRAGLKNRTANQIGMKLKGEFRVSA